MNLAEIDPVAFDSTLLQAYQRWRYDEPRRFRGDCQWGTNPMAGFRAVSNQTLLTAISEGESQRSSDSQWVNARPWVLALTLERVLFGDRDRWAMMFNREPEHADAYGERMSPRGLLHALMEDYRRPERQPQRLNQLAASADGLRDASRIFWERRSEAAKLLHDSSLDGLELFMAEPELLNAKMERLLDDTDALVPSAADLTEVWPILFATRADSGWPARLSTRWLRASLSEAGWFGGLGMSEIILPRIVGATSFALALSRLGQRFGEALRGQVRPFVELNHPYDGFESRAGCWFGLLAAQPEFHRRILGLSSAVATRQAQEIGHAVVLTLRMMATRVLMRSLAARHDGESLEQFEAMVRRAWGAPLPGPLLTWLPRLSPSDPSRILGVLAGMGDWLTFREQFDVDWFRNPRAAEQIRGEGTLLQCGGGEAKGVLSSAGDGRPRRLPMPTDALDRGLDAVRALCGELGLG